MDHRYMGAGQCGGDDDDGGLVPCTAHRSRIKLAISLISIAIMVPGVWLRTDDVSIISAVLFDVATRSCRSKRC